MNKTIVVAGSTGRLGGKIIKALLNKGAKVVALVRQGSETEKVEKLQQSGVKVTTLDMLDREAISKACVGASCVVSALQGLKDVIVDLQTVLLEGAIDAGVTRFIPSDYSVDFTKISSVNRNFDLRREFHKVLHGSASSPTSIYNGAFAEILSYNTPMLDFKKKIIGYWGNDPDWHLDFSTMDDTAAFTAAAAVDESTPKALNIASFQVSPRQLVTIASDLTQSKFSLVPMGSLEEMDANNKRERAANPAGENELFPRWQSGQYMHDQFSSHHDHLDNGRYPELSWTSASEFIRSII